MDREVIQIADDLCRQLTRERENERPRGAARTADEPVENWKKKGDGLPAAGHRRREHIAAVEARWNRGELDRGGMAKPEVLQALQQGLVELQRGKRHVPLSTGMIRMPFDARWAAFVESAGSATEPRLPAACDSVRETDRDGLARSRGAQGRTRHDAGGTARAAGQLTHEAPMATLNGTRGSSYAIRAGYGSYTCSLVSTFQQIRTILFASATTATFR